MNQTYKNYEIIFVDDCSTDNSVKIAKKLLKAPHKVIELKQKRYNGGARNEAYLHISKDVDYVWYVDSDDWLKNEYVLENINMKLIDQPDVLFVGMDSCKNGIETKFDTPHYKDRYKALLGWSGSCGKVIKKELATKQECLYNEGTLKEDKNQHYKICIHMNSFETLGDSCYVWNRDNTKSVTTKRDNPVWFTSTIRHYADTLELLMKYRGIDVKLDKLLNDRVSLCKSEMLVGGVRQL